MAYDIKGSGIRIRQLRIQSGYTAEVDLKRFGQAVSHITITGNQDVTVHFK